MAKRFVFYTLQNFPVSDGYDCSVPGDFPNQTEQDGYLEVGQMVKQLQASGQSYLDWRAAQYPWSGVDPDSMDPTPVFLDKIEVIQRYRDIRARRQAALDQAHDAELAQAVADAQAEAEELAAFRAAAKSPPQQEAPAGPPEASP